MRARGIRQQAPVPYNANTSLECAQHMSVLNGAMDKTRDFEFDGATPEIKQLKSRVAISHDLCECLLQSYGKQKAFTEGREVHHFIVEYEFDSSPHAGNILINFYTKCGTIADACDVFKCTEARNAYAWAMMISGCNLLGHAQDALAFYKQMEIEGTQLDRVSCLAVLKACATAGDLHQGKQLHTFIFTNQINLSVSVGNSLLDMYAKCGDIEHAWQVFDTMPNQDAISWNIMIAAFARAGQIREAFSFFNSMELEKFDPDEAMPKMI
ncbi:hypothetical protein L7F22_034446 [Adiantum nelumboides]|nr:hypothetical protein [Adiantum nelumboides]